MIFTFYQRKEISSHIPYQKTNIDKINLSPFPEVFIKKQMQLAPNRGMNNSCKR